MAPKSSADQRIEWVLQSSPPGQPGVEITDVRLVLWWWHGGDLHCSPLCFRPDWLGFGHGMWMCLFVLGVWERAKSALMKSHVSLFTEELYLRSHLRTD